MARDERSAGDSDFPGLTHPLPGLRVIRPRPMPAPDSPAALAHALDHPDSGLSLTEVLAGARTLAIVISDHTRNTHSELVVPALLERAQAAGIPLSGVAVVIARGLHGPCGEGVAKRLLGEAWGWVRVVEHDCDHAPMATLGATSRGTPVEINALVAGADRIVLTGSTGYHYYAGYGGGRKSLLPGVASRRAIQANHRLVLAPGGGTHPQARTGVLQGNPVHEDMVEAAALARPAFLVTVVNGPSGAPAGFFVGDWQQAHARAVAFLDAHCRASEPRAVPLVLATAGGPPYDLTLYQAHKAMDSAAHLVADGGVLVLEAGCPQGLGPAEYREFLGWASLARLESRLREGDYCVPAQTAHATLRKTARIRVLLVSRHLSAEDARLAGAVLCPDLEHALHRAQDLLGGSLPGDIPVLPAAAAMLIEVAHP